MQEREIIGFFYRDLPFPEDDCFWDKDGILKHSPGKVLVTTDSLAGGVHFRMDWSDPREIATKLWEVNLSDLVSSGGIPHFAFLNLGLPRQVIQPSWLEEFSTKLCEEMQQHNTSLVGGDTFRIDGNQPVLTLTLIGSLHPDLSRPMTRYGGQKGDYLFVSGPLGYSQMGLEILLKGEPADSPLAFRALDKHKKPRSRANILDSLVRIPVNACMDITDGLVQDAEKLAIASGLLLSIRVDLLPEYRELRRFIDRDSILTSGEELELLLLAPPESESRLTRLGFTKIGEALEKTNHPQVLFLENGETISVAGRGFLHFD